VSGTVFVVFTILAGAVGILDFLGLGPGDGAPPTSIERSAGPFAADPDLFVAYPPETRVRKQECVGLFGLCLDGPIDAAFDAFGRAERGGYPKASYTVEGGLCHGWDRQGFIEVLACEKGGEIYSIQAYMNPEAKFTLSLPGVGGVTFPVSLLEFSEHIEDASRGGPGPQVGGVGLTPGFIGSSTAQGEGFDEFVDSYYWYELSEGIPIAGLTAIGRRSWNDPDPDSYPAVNCDERSYFTVQQETHVSMILVDNQHLGDSPLCSRDAVLGARRDGSE